MVQSNSKLTFTVKEAAEILGLGRSLTYELIRQGTIPSIRLGKRWLIPKAGIEGMLGSGRQKPLEE